MAVLRIINTYDKQHGATQMKVQVFLKPAVAKLRKIDDLQTAIDTLIVRDCFMGNNPMREAPGGVLFWDWAIVSINGVEIPVPYHTDSATTSVLYTHDSTEVQMSNKECALTTAAFYLSHLLNITRYIKENQDRVDPFLGVLMSGGVDFVNKRGDDWIIDAIEACKGSLSEKGYAVLN